MQNALAPLTSLYANSLDWQKALTVEILCGGGGFPPRVKGEKLTKVRVLRKGVAKINSGGDVYIDKYNEDYTAHTLISVLVYLGISPIALSPHFQNPPLHGRSDTLNETKLKVTANLKEPTKKHWTPVVAQPSFYTLTGISFIAESHNTTSTTTTTPRAHLSRGRRTVALRQHTHAQLPRKPRHV